MLSPLSYTLLLAAKSQLDTVVETIGEGYRGQHTAQSSMPIVALSVTAVVAIILLWGGLRLQQWWRARQQDTPKWLFNELCKAHNVTGIERRLLWTAALEQHPKNPALVFIEPDSLRPPKLKFRRRVESDRLGLVARRLFGDLQTPLDRPPSGAKPKPAANPSPLRTGVPATGIDVRKAVQ